MAGSTECISTVMLINRHMIGNFETVTLRVTYQYAHRDQIEDAEFEMVKD